MTYEEIANVVKNSYERYFLVQYQDGRKERVPLFYNGKVCKFKKNSRRYGYLFDTEGIVAIQPCLTTGPEFFYKNVRKMYKCLEESGLWENKLPALAAIYFIPEAELKELLGDWNKTTETLERMGLKGISATLFHSLANKGAIKAIDFGGEGEWYREEFEEAIRENRPFSGRYRSRYDISLSVEPKDGVKRAFYSEEYKDCGNGYYYLAIDHAHAVFLEKD